MILEVFSSGPVETNSYLLACTETKRAVVVDVPFESADLLIACAEKHGVVIEKILLTHSHWDHTAEAALLKEKLNVPLYVHQEDAGNVETPGSDRLPLPFPVRGVVADAFLTDGQEIHVGTLRIQVIHTPGHTPGGVCFYLPKEKVLISGDTLFRGTIGNLSFPTASPALMWNSLKKLAALPPEIKVYPGHGGSTTIQAEHWIAHAQERM
jgi:glyoxylase-like metal-dependent hydrolase (beta-lactamase superfamily II)